MAAEISKEAHDAKIRVTKERMIIINGNNVDRYVQEQFAPAHYRSHIILPNMEDADVFVCEDKIRVYMKIEKDIIKDFMWTGDGCNIAKASVNMLGNALLGKTKAEAYDYMDNFQKMMFMEPYNEQLVKKLEVFKDFRAYPKRVACATLGCRTVHHILSNNNIIDNSLNE